MSAERLSAPRRNRASIDRGRPSQHTTRPTISAHIQLEMTRKPIDGAHCRQAPPPSSSSRPTAAATTALSLSLCLPAGGTLFTRLCRPTQRRRRVRDPNQWHRLIASFSGQASISANFRRPGKSAPSAIRRVRQRVGPNQRVRNKCQRAARRRRSENESDRSSPDKAARRNQFYIPTQAYSIHTNTRTHRYAHRNQRTNTQRRPHGNSHR